MLYQLSYYPTNCCEPLSLSPKGCRRVLTPRCSMIPHLQKEQSLGRFELTFFRLLTGSYPVQGLTSILVRSVALTESKLKGHN